MSEVHEDILISFRKARIPRRYFRDRLTEMEGADGILSYVQNEMADETDYGTGGFLISEDYTLGDRVIHSIAKSLVVRDFEVIVLTPSDLVAELEAEEPEVWHKDVVVLPDFDNPAFEENPFPAYLRYQLEEAVIRLIKVEKPIFIHCSEDTTWWSDRMMDMIRNSTRRLFV